jgi:hypothetical protein
MRCPANALGPVGSQLTLCWLPITSITYYTIGYVSHKHLCLCVDIYINVWFTEYTCTYLIWRSQLWELFWGHISLYADWRGPVPSSYYPLTEVMLWPLTMLLGSVMSYLAYCWGGAGQNNDKACGAGRLRAWYLLLGCGCGPPHNFLCGLDVNFRPAFSTKLVRVNYSFGSEFIILLATVICGELWWWCQILCRLDLNFRPALLIKMLLNEEVFKLFYVDFMHT